MGKQRQKNRDQSEYYRGIIKELEKNIRSLQRQIAYLEKYDKPIKSKEKEPRIETKLHCPECGKETISILIILDRSYLICNTCGFRVKQ